jgi:hypothetical protein
MHHMDASWTFKRLAALLGVTAWCAASLAADNSSTGRVLRCRFKAVPPQYRGVAVFDALTIGHDGSLYMGTSTYGSPANLIRYNRSNEQVAAVCDVSLAIGENTEQFIPSGKIHSQLQVASDGKIYFGSHLGCDRAMTGEHPAPYGGGHFLSYDPATGECRDLGRAYYNDSVMRVELDEPRQKLYGLTYPSAHLIVKDLWTGAITDKGQASHHGYAMPMLFADGRAYFFSRAGRIARYDPDADTIEEILEHPAPPQADGPIGDDWFYYTSMIRGLARDRREMIGVIRYGKRRFLYRFRIAAGLLRRPDFEWLTEAPPDASAAVRAPDDSIYLYAWNRQKVYAYDAKTRKALELGIPTDAKGRQARILWPACFDQDGTLHFGGVMNTDEDRFKASGYGYGALGFFTITPKVLQQAIRKAR